uniref:Reverse transcriptase domain-containing protein n=1 Tax=Tanacetum cinerariifolium TaxID=118510 RepID=A0A6L2L9Q0_TANCI|nr:hypothetical protein [Tanacetum cinerariifolium]
MKKLIAELPTLTTPKKEEELMVYLSAANEAVSVALLVERDGRQTLIHYISQTLQGAETNYPPMEKLTLVLVHAARRLRRYFQGHTIKVITDKPISQILNNQEATGRLAKWGVELESYDIKYSLKKRDKRTSTRRFPGRYNNGGQPYTGPKQTYRSCIPMEHPTIRSSTASTFKNSNKHEGQKMHAFVDSKLVANQVEGSYEARGEKTKKYKKKTLEMIRSFNNFQISHILMEENRKADALSKLVVVQCEGLTKEEMLHQEGGTWVEELPNVLWAHRITLKTSNGETPFSLAYGTEAITPAKIGIPTRRMIQESDEQNEEAHKQFKVGEFVLRKNKLSKVENTCKLGPKWEGPYEVVETYGTGAYKLRSMDGAEIPRTWHYSNLRKYYM